MTMPETLNFVINFFLIWLTLVIGTVVFSAVFYLLLTSLPLVLKRWTKE